MKAEQILPDNQNFIERDGVIVRKGSVAAFIANALILEDPDTTADERAQAARDLRELLPALRQLRLFEVFALKSEALRSLVGD